MFARILKLGLVGLIAAYCTLAIGMYLMQRDFIFPGKGEGELSAPGALAIQGSQRIQIKTNDGETLAGWYLPPARDDGVVLLFCHGNGGGLAKDVERWARIKEHGAGVLAFSYRGFPGSTGTPSEHGLYSDARAAYTWLRQKHSADRIVLHGLSLGTGVAAKLATEVEAKALVLEAPYAALVDVAAARQNWMPVSYLLWDQFRTQDFIGQVKMPILIVHGTKDRGIPFAHGQKLYDLAAKPKKLVAKEGGGHTTLVRDGLYGDIWEFLATLEPAAKPDEDERVGAN
ncbi:MAG: alpha/beta hydrolase [Alphaproteobacteria bacterium]|nr:alpha/beta hydrolase [Alphaproteobacteria bacterium]